MRCMQEGSGTELREMWGLRNGFCTWSRHRGAAALTGQGRGYEWEYLQQRERATGENGKGRNWEYLQQWECATGENGKGQSRQDTVPGPASASSHWPVTLGHPGPGPPPGWKLNWVCVQHYWETSTWNQHRFSFVRLFRSRSFQLYHILTYNQTSIKNTVRQTQIYLAKHKNKDIFWIRGINF